MSENNNPSNNKNQKSESIALEELRESARERPTFGRFIVGDALSRSDSTVTNKQAQPPAPPRPKGR
ncbi:MAG TPA: hypothetical protein VFP33_04340 [Gallionella sp.]|nr:hypothetical protein [Gallionella sp.]